MELIIQHGDTIYYPLVVDNVAWTTERKGSAGSLSFSVVDDGALTFTEGDAVRLKYKDSNIFYGFVFTKSRGKDDIIKVTAYDQLRYLKNKDTYVYTDTKASELVQQLADDFLLNAGEIEDTGFVISSRVEENETLFDMILNALDLTLTNTGEMYVLYDDFGALTLKNIGSMVVGVVLDDETGEDFSYSSSIDSEVYNKIKLTYDNDSTGAREVYIAQDSENINSWGVLQYYDTLGEGENGSAKADALLELYNKKTRSLTVTNAFGDCNVRAGCMVVVQLNLGDVVTNNLMIVESCKHTFSQGHHAMTLSLKGGEFA